MKFGLEDPSMAILTLQPAQREEKEERTVESHVKV
jgi:hypothetical protein